MTDQPIAMRWTGDAFEPLNRHWATIADRRFTIGEVYRVDTVEERSAASHAHFFAQLADVWRNLPEDVSPRFPSPEHLRKWLLIKAGYADKRSIVCASKAEAARVAAFVKPFDEYAVVVVKEAVVEVYSAQSQSMRAMGKKVFQESKDAVLQEGAAMIGVRPDQVRGAA